MTVGFFSLGQAVYRICCLIYTLDIHAFLQIVSVPLNSPWVLHFVHEIQVHYILLTLPVVINRSSFWKWLAQEWNTWWDKILKVSYFTGWKASSKRTKKWLIGQRNKLDEWMPLVQAFPMVTFVVILVYVLVANSTREWTYFPYLHNGMKRRWMVAHSHLCIAPAFWYRVAALVWKRKYHHTP